MRYLLRPPSTPWITFDKNDPEIGALFASSRSSVSPETGFFPDRPPEIASAPAPEPSNVVVSSDIPEAALSPSATPPAAWSTRDAGAFLDETHDTHVEPVASTRRIAAAVGCALGLSMLIVATAWSFGAHEKSSPATVAAASKPNMSPVETGAALGGGRVALPAPPPTSQSGTLAPPMDGDTPPAGFGRLTVRGVATAHRIYLDGKLLGQGRRFTVACGSHTLMVGTKGTRREVEVPCEGELVVSK